MAEFGGTGGAESIRLIRAILAGRCMDIYPFNSVTNCETYKGDFSRQLHRDKCPFNSITSYGRVWRKGAENVRLIMAISAGSCTEISAPSIV